MQAVLDDRDIKTIAELVIERLKKDYELVPKGKKEEPKKEKPLGDQWVGIKEFKEHLPVAKDREWVRDYLLRFPVFEPWVVNLDAGSGYPVWVNETKALSWVKKNVKIIDWNHPKPVRKGG